MATQLQYHLHSQIANVLFTARLPESGRAPSVLMRFLDEQGAVIGESAVEPGTLETFAYDALSIAVAARAADPVVTPIGRMPRKMTRLADQTVPDSTPAVWLADCEETPSSAKVLPWMGGAMALGSLVALCAGIITRGAL